MVKLKPGYWGLVRTSSGPITETIDGLEGCSRCDGDYSYQIPAPTLAQLLYLVDIFGELVLRPPAPGPYPWNSDGYVLEIYDDYRE